MPGKELSLPPHGHGLYGYSRGCRCDVCAGHERPKVRKTLPPALDYDPALLSDLLHELFPFGLTDDAPLAHLRRAA